MVLRVHLAVKRRLESAKLFGRQAPLTADHPAVSLPPGLLDCAVDAGLRGPDGRRLLHHVVEDVEVPGGRTGSGPMLRGQTLIPPIHRAAVSGYDLLLSNGLSKARHVPCELILCDLLKELVLRSAR